VPAFAAGVVRPNFDARSRQGKLENGLAQDLDDARIIETIGIIVRPDFMPGSSSRPSDRLHPLRETDDIVANFSGSDVDRYIRETAMKDVQPEVVVRMTMSDKDAGELPGTGFDVIRQFFCLGAVSEEINDNHILCIGKQIPVHICLSSCSIMERPFVGDIAGQCTRHARGSKEGNPSPSAHTFLMRSQSPLHYTEYVISLRAALQ